MLRGISHMDCVFCSYWIRVYNDRQASHSGMVSEHVPCASMARPSKLSQNSRRHKPGEREITDLVGAKGISQTKWTLRYLLPNKSPLPVPNISNLINKSMSYLLLSVCWDPKVVQLWGSSGSVLLRKLKANRWPDGRSAAKLTWTTAGIFRSSQTVGQWLYCTVTWRVSMMHS